MSATDETDARRFRVKFRDRKTGEDIEVTSVISAPDWAVLKRFSEMVKELLLDPTVQAAVDNVEVTFLLAPEGVSVKADLPSRGEVAALLHMLRPFVLEREATNFDRVCRILSTAFRSHPDLVAVIDRQRATFDGREAQSQLCMTYLPQRAILNGRSTLVKWLNAHEYHRDPEKIAEFQQLAQLIPEEGIRGVMIGMLIDMVKALHVLGYLIHRIDKLEGGAPFTVPSMPRRGARGPISG